MLLVLPGSSCRPADGAPAHEAPTMGSDGPLWAGEEQSSMSGVLDARDRDEAMRRLAAGPLDVLVIGGGITGAGAALDAASRGLRVGLVEARAVPAGAAGRANQRIH